MSNPIWTFNDVTLTLLPCGTIHFEQLTEDGSVIFDKINAITLAIYEENPAYESLCLEASDIVYEFPLPTGQFLRETNGVFPFSDPAPLPPINILSWVGNKDGTLKEMIYTQGNQLKIRQITPGGDALETILF